MDPLSDVLSLLEVRSVMPHGLTVGGPWCMAFAADGGIKMGAVLMGECWMEPQGQSAIRLHAGDCWLMSGERAYLMGSDLGLPPVAARHVFQDADEDGVAHYGGEVDFIAIAGRNLYDPAQAAFLLDLLPPLIHVPYSADTEMLAWLLRQLRREAGADRAGSGVMITHLAGMMFVQVLRGWLEGPEAPQTGWLGALRDPRMAAALTRLHGEPARSWSLAELAAACGMSRSAFAARFKGLTGLSPLDYLVRWRRRLAGRALRDGREPLARIARSCGYASDSAFSHAFKRVMGVSPKIWRDSQKEKAADFSAT